MGFTIKISELGRWTTTPTFRPAISRLKRSSSFVETTEPGGAKVTGRPLSIGSERASGSFRIDQHDIVSGVYFTHIPPFPARSIDEWRERIDTEELGQPFVPRARHIGARDLGFAVLEAQWL